MSPIPGRLWVGLGALRTVAIGCKTTKPRSSHSGSPQRFRRSGRVKRYARARKGTRMSSSGRTRNPPELPNELGTDVFIWYVPASESQKGNEANDQDRQDQADQPI